MLLASMATQDFDVETFPNRVKGLAENAWRDKRQIGTKLLGQAEYYGGVLALVAYSGILLINIVMRTFTGTQIAWGQEVILGLFAWSTWLGTAYVVKTHGHLRFTGLITKLSNRNTYLVLWIEWLLWIGFSAVAVYFSVGIIQDYQSSNAVLTATSIPTAVMFGSVPVGFGLIIVRVLEQIVVVTREFMQGENLDKYVELEERDTDDGEEEGHE